MESTNVQTEQPLVILLSHENENKQNLEEKKIGQLYFFSGNKVSPFRINNLPAHDVSLKLLPAPELYSTIPQFSFPMLQASIKFLLVFALGKHVAQDLVKWLTNVLVTKIDVVCFLVRNDVL
jgi:hypothetical protein